jgi:hypothetical protein
MEMQLYLMHVSMNDSKDSDRGIITLKMIQGLGRYELLDPETAAKVCELVAKDH